MALKIRLRQQGCNNRQTYRVVVSDSRCKRDGKYVEKLGWYLPHLNENNCQIDTERLNYWLGQGAQMSEQVETLATHLNPDLMKQFNEQKHAQRIKRSAKRRALKK